LETYTDKCDIFYIDDDPDDLYLFTSIAEELGEQIKVFTVADILVHALETAPSHPSIVLVDLNMPIKNGLEIMKEVRAYPRLRNLPFIIYSTANDSGSIMRARALGATMYIIKPASVNKIKDLIKFMLTFDWSTHEVSYDNFLVSL
jgi:CheY-like chemotaxis protein